MTNIKRLFVCNSNMFIPVVLSEVLQNPQYKYIVMSDIENIRYFFEYIDVANVTFITYGMDFAKEGLCAIIKKKKETLGILKLYEIGELVFFHAEYGDMANWLINQLSSRMPIKYCYQYDQIPSKKAGLSLKTLKMNLKYFILWGQIMDIRDAGYLFPSLPKSFFKKVKAEVIHLNVDYKVINTYLSDKFKELNLSSKYVLLTGTAIQNNWYNEKDYTNFIDKLILAIGKKNVVSKCHPRYKELYGIEKELQQVPSFIPGNLLLNYFETFIGIESTLLVEAALAGKKAISIIDWLESDVQRNIAQHDFFDNRLSGNGFIYFPKNIGEFLDIIK